MKTIFIFALMGADERILGAVLLLYFVAVLAVGLVDGWSRKRGVLGWIVSIVASVVGGMLGTLAVTVALDTPKLLFLDGTPISAACILAGLLLGSWIAVKTVNRFR